MVKKNVLAKMCALMKRSRKNNWALKEKRAAISISAFFKRLNPI